MARSFTTWPLSDAAIHDGVKSVEVISQMNNYCCEVIQTLTSVNTQQRLIGDKPVR